MEYVQLGNSRLKISRIGFGCWAMGGHGWGLVDESAIVKAVHRALDLGVNFFDTADVYGLGHSEEVLSQALGPRRHDVVIATKFGVTWNDRANIGRDISAQYLVTALDASLRRLRLDCIPLYQIHWPDGQTPISETMEALQKCQEMGKIRYIGCSNFPVLLINEAMECGQLTSLQAPYSLIQREIEQDVLPCCARHHLSVLTYGTLAKGLFSGKYDAGTVFGADDVRQRDPAFQGENFKKNLSLVAELGEVAQVYEKSTTQVALRWTLDNPLVSSVITGVKGVEQIEENVQATGWCLAASDRETLSQCTALNH